MTSVGVQADMCDPEGVVGIVRTFREQLREIQELNTSLLELRREREVILDQSQSNSEMLDGKIAALIDGAEAMEEHLQAEWSNMAAADTELEQLLNEKEHLETELHQVHGQEVAITNTDIDNEQRLMGFVEEEVSSKMDSLSRLQGRLREVQADYLAEWEGYKSDIDRFSGSTDPYQGLADHLDELKLARYIGSIAARKDDDVSSRDLCERLVTHHWNKTTYQHVNKQLIESQIREMDLENEIGTLFAQKTQLWKRCLDLEHCLDDLKDTSDEVNMLRPSSAYADLPDVSEGRLPRDSQSDLDLEGEAMEHHGTMLHRCHKNTNISITLSDEELATTSLQSEVIVDLDGFKIDPGRTEAPDAPPNVGDKDEDNTKDIETEPNKDEAPTQPAPEVDKSEVQNQSQQLFDETAPNTSFMSKLRRRVSGGSSSSQRIKGVPKLSATGSTKRLDQSSGGGRRKR